MTSPRYVLALDEGSTSARSVLVDTEGHIVAEARTFTRVGLQQATEHPDCGGFSAAIGTEKAPQIGRAHV